VKLVAPETILTSANKATMRKHISDLKAERATALYDAIDKACEVLAAGDPKNEGKTIPIVILLTDGVDVSSNITEASILKRIAEAKPRPVIFSVAYDNPNPKPGDDRPDVRFLDELSALTGGKRFDAKPTNISKALEDINGYFGRRSAGK
jgi:hypothetical protein